MVQQLKIATRGSKLALWQAERVKSILTEKFTGLSARFLEVTTRGDIDQNTPLSAFGNTGVFVKSLEEKLLNNEADLAVHSLKDVPSDLHPDLLLAAFPEREDVRDVLVTPDGQHWTELKTGAVIGTSSPARKEQLKLLRPDLQFKDIRGNVDTRVRKVENGEYDATILAAAGLKRLGYKISHNSYFMLNEAIPSPGQGALVVQVRKDNLELINLLGQINNKCVEQQVRAERQFMKLIGGGCRYPVAAHADVKDGSVTFRAMAHKPNWRVLEKREESCSFDQLFNCAEKVAFDFLSRNQ